MKTRRSMLAGLAAAVTGVAGLALGSGAFSSVSADRNVSITISEDSKALLGLVPNDDLDIVREEDGRLELDSELLSEATEGFNNQATVSIGALDDGDVVDGEEAFRVVNNFDRGLSVKVDVDDVQPSDDGELEVIVTDPDGETESSTTSADELETEPDEALLVALEFRTRDEPAEGEITFEAVEIIS